MAVDCKGVDHDAAFHRDVPHHRDRRRDGIEPVARNVDHPRGTQGDAIMGKVVQKELDADPGRKGSAVIIEIERITNLRGDAL